MADEQFIEHDFNLPDHSNELLTIEEALDKIKTKFKTIIKDKSIDNKIHDQLYERIIRVLDYTGRLSEPAFAIEKRLEGLYTLKYLKCPAIGKKLWLDHYGSIHHPYNLIKNRCFRMLEELDEEYIKRLKKYPPNWNP